MIDDMIHLTYDTYLEHQIGVDWYDIITISKCTYRCSHVFSFFKTYIFDMMMYNSIHTRFFPSAWGTLPPLITNNFNCFLMVPETWLAGFGLVAQQQRVHGHRGHAAGGRQSLQRHHRRRVAIVDDGWIRTWNQLKDVGGYLGCFQK